MRRVPHVLLGIGVGCFGLLGAQTQSWARGAGGAPPVAPAQGPTLEARLVAAAKALTDTNPTLIGEASLGSKHPNTLAGELIDLPVACATTVKGSKSNTSERKRASPTLTATFDKAAAPSQPLLRVAKREAVEAFVGTITTDRELALRSRDASRAVQRIPAGTYGVVARAKEKEALVAIEIQDADGKTIGGVAVSGDALAAQLVPPPEQKAVADYYANAVIQNFVVAMLDEDLTPGAVVLAVRAIGRGMEPIVGSLGKLHIGWEGGGLDFVPGRSVVVGSETIAVGDIAEVRIEWRDAPAGRIPSATIVTRGGGEVPITTGRGPLTAIDLSMAPGKGAPAPWTWKPGASADRPRRPSELTGVTLGK